MKKHFIILSIIIFACSNAFAGQIFTLPKLVKAPEIRRSLSTRTAETTTNANSQSQFNDMVFEHMMDRDTDFSIQIRWNFQFSEVEEIFNEGFCSAFETDYYLAYTYINYTGDYSGSNGNVTINFTFRYKSTVAEEEYVTTQVRQILSQIIDEEMTQEEKVKAIWLWIRSNVHDTDYAHIDTYNHAYDALVHGETQCNGYASLFHRMLEESGIESRPVFDYGLTHVWNLVKICGNWWIFDVGFNQYALQHSDKPYGPRNKIIDSEFLSVYPDTPIAYTEGYCNTFIPTVDAGSEITIGEGSLVTLTGTASEPYNGIASVLWEQTSGETITLTNSDTEHATFTAPDVEDTTELAFKFTATSVNGNSAFDTVPVTVNNVNGVPIAEAGSSQTVDEFSKVELNGNGSSDDGTLTYLWEQVSGTSVTLVDSDESECSFTAPGTSAWTDSILEFKLTVTDDENATASDTVTITIQDAGVLVEGGTEVSLTATNGQEIVFISDQDVKSIYVMNMDHTTNDGKPDQIPYGFINFSLSPIVGGTATVTITLPSAAPDLYKWYGYKNGSWAEFGNYEFNSDRTQVTLTIIDGGVDDEDGLVNGSISDSSGLGYITPVADDPVDDPVDDPNNGTVDDPTTPSGDSGGGGGCFIGTIGQTKSNGTHLNWFYAIILFTSIIAIIAERRKVLLSSAN